ncbi:DUF1254 domain-containing protein [Methanosarcina sp. KYL-1]|uniref:DUF1254 domain-containing protein n=1 Tax=Methanosarcina sp. KYL-1 TaxID=2602068 RepID=UPI002100E5E6|nr:DUF1254 domain-containing protein [Methanosarcina sp. KYL-1]MCQ1536386.1 DUF1254 domain-containing protein [Methanosarcina sp. KYL-1]
MIAQKFREVSGSAPEASSTTGAAEIAEEAYLYGLQQVIFYETRYNYTQAEDSNVHVGVNRYYLVNEGKPITPDFKAVVTPNATTLYATAFLDLQEEPLVMEVPGITDRYFSLQLMDQYGIYFLYAGNQFNGTRARTYLIVPELWGGKIPADFTTTEVIHAPSRMAFANIRIALMEGSEEEVHHINNLQDQCTITPLSKWVENGHRGVLLKDQELVPGKYRTFPRMAELTTRQVDRQTAEDFFTFLNLVLNDPSMPLMKDSEKESDMLCRLAKVGIGPGKNFQWSKLDRDIRDGLTEGFISGYKRLKKATQESLIPMNGWMVLNAEGGFGTEYLMRAVMADAGWGGPDSNVSHVGAFLFLDSDGNALEGKYRYTLTFDMDDLPPVTEFWSVPIYDASGYFVANELNRYTISSFMVDRGDLHVEDGKLTIYVQHEKPTEPAQLQNWLPAPERGFRFTARFYGPKMPLVDGSYNMPRPVRKK